VIEWFHKLNGDSIMVIQRSKNIDLKNSLLREVILENNKWFKEDYGIRRAFLKVPKAFNYTYLIEETMALSSEGKYDFVDASHYDFSDLSECKTASIQQDRSKNNTSYYAYITNVQSEAGNLKVGGIRAVIFNPFKEKLHYIFIPKDVVHTLMHTKNGDKKKSRNMRFSYRMDTGFQYAVKKYGFIECHSFKELAMIENH
jgi:hypothetical protein